MKRTSKNSSGKPPSHIRVQASSVSPLHTHAFLPFFPASMHPDASCLTATWQVCGLYFRQEKERHRRLGVLWIKTRKLPQIPKLTSYWSQVCPLSAPPMREYVEVHIWSCHEGFMDKMGHWFIFFLFFIFLIFIFTLFYFTILYWFCHT